MEKKASIFIGCLIYFTALAIVVASILSEEEEEKELEEVDDYSQVGV